MTAADIQAIRDALAAGPTSGAWKHKRHADVMVGTLRLCHVNAAAKLGMGEAMHRCDVNAAYIAAVHPERIARLLAALEDAQKDAARLDWLNENPDKLRRSAGYLGSASSWTVRDADGVAHDFMSARAAIDAARGAP